MFKVSVLIANFEHISHLALSSVSIANFEQVNAAWDVFGKSNHTKK